MGITTIRILGTLEPGRIGMVSWSRGCSARGKAEQLVLFCSDFYWIFVRIGLCLFFDLADLFGFYLAFLHGFVLWKLHEIKVIRSVMLFIVCQRYFVS